MNTRLIGLALAALWIGAAGTSALADQDHHPTVHAIQRYTNRKVAHVDHAVYHAHAHYKHWKQRKGHNIRAWLNRH